MHQWHRSAIALFASTLFAPVLFAPTATLAAQLSQWQASSSQLSFRTDGPTQPPRQPQVSLVENPVRLVIDLPGVTLSPDILRQAAGQRPEIREIRVGQPTPQTARIVIELAPGYGFNLSRSPLRQLNPTSWAIDFSGITPQPGTPNPPSASTPPVSSPPTRPANPRFCRSNLNSALSSILDRASGTRWSVIVQPQSSATSLFSRNATTLLAPASNNKIFTSAAAFVQFGPQSRIRTSVMGDGSGPNVTTLRIIGQGDPSFSTADLQDLSQQLQRRGIRQVGTLIGDDTLFQGPTINPSWEAEDEGQAYAAPVNSLILNENIIGITLVPQRRGQPLRVTWDDPLDQRYWTVDNRSVTVAPGGSEFVEVVPTGTRMVINGQLREGSSSELAGVAIPNEGNYFVRKFDDILETAQINVAKTTVVKRTPAPPGLTELAAVESPPLSDLIDLVNQQSNNLYTEALLKRLGVQANPRAADSTQSGTAAVRSILASLGVETNQVQMIDGSGLAPNNRASALALVQTLQAMARRPDGDRFRRSLPIGGRTGTLSRRFVGSPAQDRVFAKTGTISGVVSLSGYITPRPGGTLVFGAIANTSSSAATIRALIDEMVVHLAQLESGC